MMCIECYGETSPWLLEIRMNQLAEIYISCSGYSPVFFQTKCCTEAVKSKCNSSCGDGPIQHIFHQIQKCVNWISWFVGCASHFLSSPEHYCHHYFPSRFSISNETATNNSISWNPSSSRKICRFDVNGSRFNRYNCLSIAIRLNFQRRTTHILIDISSFHWMWSAWNATEIGWKFSEQWIKKKSIFFSTPMGFWTVSAVNRCE